MVFLMPHRPKSVCVWVALAAATCISRVAVTAQKTAELSQFDGLEFLSYSRPPLTTQEYSPGTLSGFPVDDALSGTNPKITAAQVSAQRQYLRLDADLEVPSAGAAEPSYQISWAIGMNLEVEVNASRALLVGSSASHATTQKLPSHAPAAAKAACNPAAGTCTSPINAILAVDLWWNPSLGEPAVRVHAWSWLANRWSDVSDAAACAGAATEHQGNNSLYNIPTFSNLSNAYTSGAHFVAHCRADAILLTGPARGLVGADSELNVSVSSSAVLASTSTQETAMASTALDMSLSAGFVVPVQHEYIQLVAMRSSTCALYLGGRVRCWGLNTDGRLGLSASLGDVGDDELPSAVPTVNLGGERAAFLAGLNTVCAVTDQQNVFCWGENGSGNLGRGDAVSSSTPMKVELAASAIRVAVAEFHVCALLAGGLVQCWGSGTHGKLGYDSTDSAGSTQTVQAAGLGTVGLPHTVIDVAVGTGHTCVLYSTHEVACWGEGNNGALGYGSTDNVADAPARTLGSAVVSLPVGQGFPVQITASGDYTCVLLSEGSVSCWGKSTSGQTGMGSTATWGHDSGKLPSDRGVVSLGGRATYLALGTAHACALLMGGRLQCWGSNGDGQLGVGDLEDVGAESGRLPSAVGPVRLADFALTASAGGFHTCWVERGGAGRCIGRGTLGRLGYGNTEDVGDDETSLGSQRLQDFLPGDVQPAALGSPSCPVAVDSQPMWIDSIVPGISHTCITYNTGSVRCFGSNADGQLGLGKTGDIGLDRLPYSAPEIQLGAKVLQITANIGTCALVEGGKVMCWGPGQHGVNGYGNTDTLGQEQTPAELGYVSVSPDSRQVTAISRGSENVCVIMDDGKVRCWGRGAVGNHGQGNNLDLGATPTTLPSTGIDLEFGSETAVKLSVGRVHSCFVMQSGKVYCIGGFANGRTGYNQNVNSIGNNEDANAEGPVPLVGSATAVDVGCVDAHTCVLLNDATVQCWGSNEYGQLALENGTPTDLGDDAGENGVNNVAPLPRDVVQIAVAFSHTCVLYDDGSVACFGRGLYGRLGYGDESNFGLGLSSGSDFARRVPLHGVVKQLTTESLGTCVVYERGAFSCWGSGFNGRLGTGNQNRIGDDETPADVAPQSGAPTDLVIPWSNLDYTSLAAAACPGSYKSLLNPRMVSMPPSALTAALETVPAWVSNLVSIASGLDAPDFPPGSSLLCAQMNGDQLRLEPSEPGARSRSRRVFCQWPQDWARKDKVTVNKVTARDGTSSIAVSTTGGDTIMLHGRLWPFALVNQVGLPVITIGEQLCTEVTIVSIQRLTCVAPPLSVEQGGGNVSISVAHHIPQEATPVHVEAKVTYAPPRLIAADPPIDILFTGQSVQLIGQYLGDVTSEVSASALQRSAVQVDLYEHETGGVPVAACNVTRFWDSGVRCDVPPRQQHGFGRVYAEVVVANQVSNKRTSLSYAVPTIESLSPNFVLTPDQGPVNHHFDVVGTYFGAPWSTVRIYVESIPCDVSTRLSSTRARCTVHDSATLRSIGARATVKIDIDNSNATAVGALRVYGKINLTPIAPQSLPRDGREIVLSGSEFGRFPATDPSGLSAAGDIASVTFGASSQVLCGAIRVTGDSLSCTVPPGLGSLSPVTITRRNGSSQQVTAELSYAPASISRIDPDILLYTPASNTQQMQLHFYGTGFDFAVPSGPAPAVTGSIAGTPCVGGSLTVLNASAMSCSVQASALQPSSNPRTSIRLEQEGIAVAVLSSVEFTVTQPPTVSALQPSIVPAPGNLRVTLIGIGFGAGRADDIASVQISAAPCSSIIVIDSFSLTCVVPPADQALGSTGGNVADVTLTTAAGASFTFTGGLSYSRPEILNVLGGDLQVHPVGSTATATVIAGGLNLFDGGGVGSQFRIKNLTCAELGGTAIFAPSGRTAECRDLRLGLLPQLQPGDSALSLVSITTALGQRADSVEGSIRITGPPLIGLLSPARAAEGDRVTIAGNNLGRSQAEVAAVKIGDVVLNSSQYRWTSGSSIVIDALPPAQGRVADVPVSVTVVAGYSTTTEEQQGVTYIVPITAPTRQPSTVCGYRDASGAARVAFAWQDDATTSSNGVAEWQLTVTTDISATNLTSSQSGAGGLTVSQRRIPGDEGTTNPGHLSTLPAVCRTMLAPVFAGRRTLQAAVAAAELIDVRISDAPERPFWVLAAAATQNEASSVLPGPASELSNAVFSSCSASEYLSTQFARQGDFAAVLCRDCPEGALCNGLPFEGMTNAPGFMQAPWDDTKLTYIPCGIADTCSPAPVRRLTSASLSYLTSSAATGSQGVTAPASSFLPQAAFDLVEATANSTEAVDRYAACSVGHTGPACGVCQDGYANQGDGRCAKCAPRTTIIGALVGGTLVALVVIAYLIYSTVAAAGQPAQTYVAMNKLLLTHLQQISLASVFPMQWPGYILSMFEAFETTSSVSDSLISVECLELDPVSQFRGGAITTLVIPIFALAFCASLWYCVVPLYRRWKANRPAPPAAASSDSQQEGSAVDAAAQGEEGSLVVAQSPVAVAAAAYTLSSSEGMIVSAIVVAFLLHLSLAEASLSLMTCRTIDGQSLLAADLTVDCNDPANKLWMLGIGLPGFIIYGLGIPAAAFGLLYRNRAILFQTRGQALFGFLVSSLEPEWYFWESIVQWRKVFLTVVATLMEPLGLGLRVTTSMVLLSLFMVAHLLAMPYQAIILDKFEAASAVVTLTTLAAGSTLVDDDVARTSKVVVSLLVVIINALLLAAMVGTLILEALRDPVIQETLKMVGITVPRRLLVAPASKHDAQPATGDKALVETASPSAPASAAKTTQLEIKPAAVSQQDSKAMLDDSIGTAVNPIGKDKRPPRGNAGRDSTKSQDVPPPRRQAFN